MAGLKEITSTKRLLDIIYHRKDEIKKEPLDTSKIDTPRKVIKFHSRKIFSASAATMELNLRERLELDRWRLKNGAGQHPVPNVAGTVGNGISLNGPSTAIGTDWNSDNPITSSSPVTLSVALVLRNEFSLLHLAISSLTQDSA